jgi:dTMP kinase
MTKLERGLFITFEGVDGVGKSTQVHLLKTALEVAGLTVTTTLEPGGTKLGREIREMLLHSSGTTAPSDRTEALLFAADRAQHVDTLIRPALERGEIVISDRYVDSSIAYQSGGRELSRAEVRELSMWATHGLMPERTYLLTVDSQTSSERVMGERGYRDRMESEDMRFKLRTEAMFLEEAERDSERFRVISTVQTIEQTHALILQDAQQLLSRHGCEVALVPSEVDD